MIGNTFNSFLTLMIYDVSVIFKGLIYVLCYLTCLNSTSMMIHSMSENLTVSPLPIAIISHLANHQEHHLVNFF